jgi:tripartite-type tricarboxylate transporter receptor subunit TctC
LKGKKGAMKRHLSFSLFPFLFSLGIVATDAQVASTGSGQDYPSRPIRLIVPFPAGGSIDIVARSIAQRWSPLLGQQFVIDNRGGAAGAIGTQLVAHAPADGYTLLYGNLGPLSIGPHLTPAGYDIFRDFAPIAQVTSSPFMIFASATLPVNTAKELIAYARERPGKLNYASSGIGSGLHLAGELFQSVAGVKFVHVPFKGMGQAAPEIATGRVQLAVSTVPGVLAHVKAGRMKGIVSSGRRRSAQLPDVQTCIEAGLPGFCSSAWHAVVAPARTPKPVIARIHRTLVATLASQELRDQLLRQEDAETVGSMPEELAKFLRSESARWARIIKEVGVTAE